MTVEEVGVAVMNQSDLPDETIRQVVAERWLDISETAAFTPGGFGSYSFQQTTPTSMFVRGDFRTPTNVIEEMELALRLYEEDDDVSSTIDFMTAIMFQGMKNLHEDAETVFRFNALAGNANLDLKLRELITGIYKTGQVYPLKLFSSTAIANGKSGANPRMVMPNMLFLNPMTVRVVEIDGTGEPVLVQEVDQRTHDFLLAIGKGESKAGGAPSAAQQVKRSDNPIAAALYTEQFVPDREKHGDDDLISGLKQAWFLNTKMVSRYALTSDFSTSKYAPLLMKRVFGLCEAKRLLNLADYALLNGAVNFLVVVRKGSDKLPANQAEITNLTGIVSRAARTGIMVGDHRLDVEIIMPNMEHMLNPEKRNLLGEKIASSLTRMPSIDFGRVEGGGTPQAEIVAQVLMSDRRILKRKVEKDVYQETALRNGSAFPQGAPKLAFPRITLNGAQWFTEYILKLRDRGDIPRSWAIEALDLDSESAMVERQREINSGFDEVMTAQNVPSGNTGPQNTGRPSRSEGGGNNDEDPVQDQNRDTGGE